MATIRSELQSTEVARQSANRVGFGFLLAELGAGIAFADVALSTKDIERRRRNTANAKKAYVTIIRFMTRVVFTDIDASAFHSDFGSLRKKLSQLGVAETANSPTS